MIPANPMNAKPLIPAVTKAIGIPLRALGTFAESKRIRIAVNVMIMNA